uniref:Uncharacterized protein n=1 Tax=Glossina pallidipes TaxID=7398 RepID=A0A1A9ZV62_GLOPL
MFSVCKQSHPATTVKFIISCPFFNNSEENLVVAGANVLQVFRIYPYMDQVCVEAHCAVMVVYGKRLLVLPFRKHNGLDEIELADVKPIKKTPTTIVARTPILASYSPYSLNIATIANSLIQQYILN